MPHTSWFSTVNILLPHCFSMLLPTFCFFFNLYWQFLTSFRSLSSYQTATRSINSHVNAKFLTFVARVMQKLYSGNGPFSFSGYLPIYRSSRTVQAKQNFSAGVSIESRVTTLRETACTLPSLTRCRRKADFCKVQVPFHINRRRFGLNWPWLKRAGSYCKALIKAPL